MQTAQRRIGSNYGFSSSQQQLFKSSLRQSSIAASATIAAATATTTSAINGEGSDSSTKPATPSWNIRLNVNEKARTVTSVCTSGTLCTLSSATGSGRPVGGPEHDPDVDPMVGVPFGSFVDYVLDDDGNPVFLMNEMSMHTINIAEDPRVTLFTQLEHRNDPAADAQRGSSAPSGGIANKGQDVSRCSVTGIVNRIPPDAPDLDIIRMRYSLTHTYADQVMGSPKFAFYRLIPQKIYFVGGFGVLAKWIKPEDYRKATPDILAIAAMEIAERLHRDYQDDLRLTAQQLLNIDSEIVQLRVTNVDRLGFDLRVTAQQKSRRNKLQTDEFRLGFRIPVQSVEDAKSEILKIFQEAWEKANGVDWGEGAHASPGASVPFLKIAADSLE